MLQVRGITESLDENSAQPTVNVFYFLVEIKGVLLKLLQKAKERVVRLQDGTGKVPQPRDPEISPLVIHHEVSHSSGQPSATAAWQSPTEPEDTSILSHSQDHGPPGGILWPRGLSTVKQAQISA